MQHRKLFLTKDVNYGASKTSSTAETALNPNDLADGALGIYGIHEAGSTNVNKLVLITDGGSEGAGKVPAASFVGKEIFIACGRAEGCRISNPIQRVGGIRSIKSAVYTAPVKAVHVIGYTSTVSGSNLNLPTLVKGDEFGIQVYNRNYAVSGQREPGQKVILSTQALTGGETEYEIIKKWLTSINKRTDEILIDKATIKVTDNGSGSAFANSATVAAVNGATSLTTSANHGVGVGDYVRLDGDYYQAITGTATTTLVLDRAYQGPTQTIANANTLDLGASASTALGIQFSDDAFFMNTTATVNGVLENATVTLVTAPVKGSGSYAEVLDLEKDVRVLKGTADMITEYIPKDALQADSTLTYDLYYIEAQSSDQPKGENGSVFKVLNYTIVGFPSTVADTGGKNQSNFEDVMVNFYSALVTLF